MLSRQDPTLDTIDAKAGDIYNTVTGEWYKGGEGIKVVPCAYQRRFLEWMPRGSGSGAPKTSTLRLTSGQKSNAVLRTTEIMWLVVRAAILRKHTNILC